jgi:hypothetical protein
MTSRIGLSLSTLSIALALTASGCSTASSKSDALTADAEVQEGDGIGADVDAAAAEDGATTPVDKAGVEPGDPCDDDDPCTSNDVYDDGLECSGEPYSCDDELECTADECDGAGSCKHILDGNWCLVASACRADGEASPEDACSFCDPEADATSWTPKDGVECDDGDPCTQGDQCVDSQCISGTEELDCDDQSTCTKDKCIPEVGCTYSNVEGDCDDGDPCTLQDACTAGVCVGSPLDCDDLDPCTNDSCDPATLECLHQAHSDPCDDEDECTETDACTDGVCIGVPKDCDDGNPCTNDACDPSLAGGCINDNMDVPCDDGDACTEIDMCVDGECVAGDNEPDCDDHNPCTADMCDSDAGCKNLNIVTECDDGNPCTADDMCANGTCAGSTNLCECQVNGDCLEFEDGDLCNGVLFCDGNVCNIVAGSIVTCQGGVGTDCKVFGCNPDTGTCGYSFPNEGGECDDGDKCTSDDTCAGGECLGLPVVDCGVGDPCNGDADCVPGLVCLDGVCEKPPCPEVCTGHTVEAYLCALDMCFDELITSAQFTSPSGDNIEQAWEAVSHFGAANNDLAPWKGDSYGLLATGPATGTSHSKDLVGGGPVGDPFSNDGYQTYDNVEFNVVMTAPPGTLGFAIDFVFLSVEYEEWIGSSFNDKFYIILKAPQTTEDVKTVINYGPCSNPAAYHDFIDEAGNKKCFMAINTAFSEPCSNVQTDISGTGFSCGEGDAQHGSSTGWLTLNYPIQSGETFELTFHIHDASDGIYDSEVILDNFRWLTGAFVPGVQEHE